MMSTSSSVVVEITTVLAPPASAADSTAVACCAAAASSGPAIVATALEAHAGRHRAHVVAPEHTLHGVALRAFGIHVCGQRGAQRLAVHHARLPCECGRCVSHCPDKAARYTPVQSVHIRSSSAEPRCKGNASPAVLAAALRPG